MATIFGSSRLPTSLLRAINSPMRSPVWPANFQRLLAFVRLYTEIISPCVHTVFIASLSCTRVAAPHSSGRVHAAAPPSSSMPINSLSALFSVVGMTTCPSLRSQEASIATAIKRSIDPRIITYSTIFTATGMLALWPTPSSPIFVLTLTLTPPLRVPPPREVSPARARSGRG